MRSQIFAVQKMQDYIEAHLTEEVTLADLADVCSFSPWYAHRLFRAHTGYSPAEYIRRIRLAKSALRLKREHTRIIDIAYDLGFSSVDGYTRAFRKEFGINPGEYAKSPVPIQLFVAYGVKFKELRKEFSIMSEPKNVFIQVIQKPRRKVIIKRGIKADIASRIRRIYSAGAKPVCSLNRRCAYQGEKLQVPAKAASVISSVRCASI